MSHASKVPQRLSLLMLALSLLSSLGCTPSVCIRPVLPVEPVPALRQVDMYPPGSPQGQYCLTDRGRRDVLINLELYRAALEASRETVRLYNETVKQPVGADPLPAKSE